MTALPDLVELTGLASNTTYGYTGANQIIGVVDNATYTGDDDNGPGEIVELNETGSDGGILTIDGVQYTIGLAVPDGDPVVIHYGDGTTQNVTGGGLSSNVAFIIASPIGGGPVRYFAAFDDDLGDLPNIAQIETGVLDFSVAGDDVVIDLEGNNDVGVVCFASGTSILTMQGPLPIERLRRGDLVLTADHGPQPVRWVCSTVIDARRDPAVRHLLPVVIRADALAPGYPAQDLTVSPQHRILVDSPVAERMFGAREVLMPAVKMIGHPGIERAKGVDRVVYHHILTDRHEIVFANGTPTETMLRGPEALQSLSGTARYEIHALFPDGAMEDVGEAVRPVQQSRRAIRRFLSRHARNRKPLLHIEPLRRAG
ncbi:MAG: Hint domain-containing protein [Paracoccaceae bacterium]